MCLGEKSLTSKQYPKAFTCSVEYHFFFPWGTECGCFKEWWNSYSKACKRTPYFCSRCKVFFLKLMTKKKEGNSSKLLIDSSYWTKACELLKHRSLSLTYFLSFPPPKNMKENSSGDNTFNILLHILRYNMYHRSKKILTLKYHLQGRVHRAQWEKHHSSYDSFPSGALLGRK